MHHYHDDVLKELLAKKGKKGKLHYAESYISLAVRNDGDVIPASKIPRLVERFYRVDSSRGEAVGGSGIGLSIVQRVIEHHNGVLDISSSVEEGNIFRVYFPLIAESSAKQDAALSDKVLGVSGQEN